MRDTPIRLLQLAYFMAPAYCANMVPPFVRYWSGWNRPIHERWFGGHKTIIGFLAGVGAAVLATAVQRLIEAPFSLVSYERWVVLGLGFGVGAMAGDSAKSFFKRRIGISPGAKWVPFDQLDFAIGALALTAWHAGLGVADVLTILAMTFVGDVAINRLAYRLGVKDHPW